MFALLDENRIVEKFSLQCQGKNPSQLRSMPLYYSLGGNITSLSGLFYPQSFCSPIIRGILRHLWGCVPSIALSLPDERGFPIWYAVKVIWIAVMFLYNMHCQAKTGKHFFPPKKLISALLFITTATNILHLYEHAVLSFRQQDKAVIL